MSEAQSAARHARRERAQPQDRHRGSRHARRL